MKTFKGKAIYNPSGKAGEYSKWACNFYVGCSNDCTYCYLKKGIGAKTLGGSEPTLKKCFKNESHALEVFAKELDANHKELKKHGLFFSFSTDPMLPETIGLTQKAIRLCLLTDVPVKVLTKCAEWVYPMLQEIKLNDTLWNLYLLDGGNYKQNFAIGFTLTGHDELEPNASPTQDRIDAMRRLHKEGFKTFASIEPIIDFQSAKKMISQTLGFCDLYKIGLMSGKKYDVGGVQAFVEWLNELEKPKIYLKESLQKLSRYTNEELGEYFVSKDYNLFNLV